MATLLFEHKPNLMAMLCTTNTSLPPEKLRGFCPAVGCAGRDAFVPLPLLEVSLHPSCELYIPLCSPKKKTQVTFKQTSHKAQLPPVLFG